MYCLLYFELLTLLIFTQSLIFSWALPGVVTMCTCVQGCVGTITLVLYFGSCLLSGEHACRFSLITATSRENWWFSLYLSSSSIAFSLLPQEVELRRHHQDLLGWTVSPTTTTKTRFTLAPRPKLSAYVFSQSGDRARIVTKTHHWRWKTAMVH